MGNSYIWTYYYVGPFEIFIKFGCSKSLKIADYIQNREIIEFHVKRLNKNCEELEIFTMDGWRVGGKIKLYIIETKARES